VETVKMPVGAKLLNILEIYGTPTIFAVIEDSEVKLEERKFYRFRTGFVAKNVDKLTHVASYMVQAYGHVFHIFEDVSKGQELKKQESE